MSRTQRLYDEHRRDDPDPAAISHTGDIYVEGCPTCYPPEDAYADLGWDIPLARSRGYDSEAHFIALLAEDIDAISLTHPTNWLTEAEVERV